MRLDKFICDCTGLTRSQAGKLIRQGLVLVDQQLCKQPATQLKPEQQVELEGEVLQLTGPRYFVMHKPAGYVCSTDDPDHNTVFVLMDEPRLDKLHTVGRLDLDTTGLLLITDDVLRGEKHLTKAAELEIIHPQECLLTIHEGRYHQVKRMFAAIGNKVEKLHREKIGDFVLDANTLAEGEYRHLTPAEAEAFVR